MFMDEIIVWLKIVYSVNIGDIRMLIIFEANL